MSERFVFGIPLIARGAARDWAVVDHLFGLTLRSLLAQDDGDFRVILAAHDVPAAWGSVAGDSRFGVIAADWPVAAPTAANDDGGRKKWLIRQAVRAAGGGLLMFLDADDWIARDLVRTARSAIGPDDVGGLVADGFALDHASLNAMPFPIAGAFAGPFHALCGSSTIGRIDAAAPHERDPQATLGSHHEWRARAAELGLPLALLPTSGVYVIGTGQNHSEAQSPFAAWRGEVTAAVRRGGTPLTPAAAARFGQEADRLRAPG